MTSRFSCYCYWNSQRLEDIDGFWALRIGRLSCNRVGRNVHMGTEIPCPQSPLISEKITWYIFIVGYKSFHRMTPGNYIPT